MLIPPVGDWSLEVRRILASCLVTDVLLGRAFFGALLLSIAALAGRGEILHVLVLGTERAFYPEDFLDKLHRWYETAISVQVTLLIIGIPLALPATVVQLGWTCKDERNVVAAKAH